MDEALLTRPLPWNTGPSGEGSATCAWCGRNIYAPAEPCSVQPIDDIETLVPVPGLGDRCLYEMRTRGFVPRG